MICVAFTPYKKHSRGFIDLKEFLNSHRKKSKEIITLPEGAIEIDKLNNKEQIFNVLSFNPKRAIVIDATNPDLISDVLKEFKDSIGTKNFNAGDLKDRFYIISESFYGTYVLNQLITKDNTHLKNLLEKPFAGQII